MFNTFWMSTRWAIISLVFGTIIINAFTPNFYWDNELFHVLIESGGSLIGFGLALIIIAMIQKSLLPLNCTWLIACFISMGTLDMFHSQLAPGQVFVWLHSVATFIGGLFAMLIWLPESTSKRFFKPRYLLMILTISVGFSISSIIYPEFTLTMLDNNKKFTLSANILNVAGGIGFLITWLYFAREYHYHHHIQSFYFSNHFCLFGIAGLLFEISILWDGNWWFWHMIRAFAYGLLIFHFSLNYWKSLLIKIDQSDQMFDQILNEVYMFDKETLHFTNVNLAALKNLNYSINEMREMTPIDIAIAFTKEKFDELTEPLISNKEKQVVFRTTNRRKNGSDYPVEVHLQITNKEPYLFFAIVIDITKLKESEKESKRLQDELQQAQKMESLGQLTGGIAHDFNNILAVISGFSELATLQIDKKIDGDIRDYMKNIKHATNRATNLVRQMLTFSRDTKINNEPLDLSSLIKDDIEMLRSSFPSTIEIKTDIATQLPHVLMDKTQLYQILMNLLVNARDAMDGVGKISIRLRLNKEPKAEFSISHKPIKGQWIELIISDTGTGIKQDDIQNIFNPFFTTKEVGKGTGMGLSLIYRIIENQGGHILLETKLGKGTTFRILFPPIMEENKILSSSTQESDHVPNGNGSEILIIDDELLIAQHISELLKNYNYKPHYEFDSTEAYKLFKQDSKRFSLLITDQTMPKMTGIELIHKIRTIRPSLPVIMCTGFSDKVNESSAAELDICYMSKPVEPKKLLRKIADLITQT